MTWIDLYNSEWTSPTHLRGRAWLQQDSSLQSPDELTSAPQSQDNYIHLWPLCQTNEGTKMRGKQTDCHSVRLSIPVSFHSWWSLWKKKTFVKEPASVFTRYYKVFYWFYHQPSPCPLSVSAPPHVDTLQKWGNVRIFMAVIFDQILSGFPRTGSGWVTESAGWLPLAFLCQAQQSDPRQACHTDF